MNRMKPTRLNRANSNLSTAKLPVSRRTNSRQGASLIVVLALLVVCGTIMLQLLGSSLRHRLQFRRELQREQTRWLKRAADDLAKSDPQIVKDKSGQTMKLTLPHFGEASLIFETKDDDNAHVITSQIGSLAAPDRLTRLKTVIKSQPPQSKPKPESTNIN